MRRTYKVFDRLVAKESSTVASAGATQRKPTEDWPIVSRNENDEEKGEEEAILALKL